MKTEPLGGCPMDGTARRHTRQPRLTNTSLTFTAMMQRRLPSDLSETLSEAERSLLERRLMDAKARATNQAQALLRSEIEAVTASTRHEIQSQKDEIVAEMRAQTQVGVQRLPAHRLGAQT